MLEKYLKELLKKDNCNEEEIGKLIEYINEEKASNLLNLIRDENFSKILSQSTTKIESGHDEISLNFAFIMMLIQVDTVYFKKIIEIPLLKQIFLCATNQYWEEKFENPWFEPIISKGPAFENLVAIVADEELKNSFCKSRHAGRDLIAFTSNHPSCIKEIISDPELKVAITKDRSHHVAIRDILYNSQNKKDADMVFSDPIFGGWGESLKIHIYNIIAKNYRESLPNSLVKLCLFSIDENKNTLLGIKDIPEDLQEAIHNFSITQ